MKTTSLRQVEDGEYRIQYRVDSDGGNIEIIGAQLLPTEQELDIWKLPSPQRRALHRTAEDHADAWDRELSTARLGHA